MARICWCSIKSINGNNIWDNTAFTSIEGSTVTYVPIHNLSNTTVYFSYQSKEVSTNELLTSDIAAIAVNIIPLNDAPIVFDVTYPPEENRDFVTDGYQFNLVDLLDDVDTPINNLIIEFLPELEDTDGDGSLDDEQQETLLVVH